MPEEVKDTSAPEVDTQSPEEVNIDTGVEEQPEVEEQEEEQEEQEEVVEEKKPLNWYENLPPDFKNDPDVTKYKSLEEYVKGNREVRKLIGKDKVVVPTDKSSEEEWNAFYKKLGRPDKFSDYVAPELPEDVPDEIKIKPENMDIIRERAHKLGYTKKQFAESISLINELNLNAYNQELEKFQKMKETSMTNLRQEWGAATDSKIDGAQKVINTFFGNKKLHPAFKALSSDEGFVKGMAEIAESVGEDKIAGIPRATMTPKEAQAKINAIMAGDAPESKAYFDDTNPEHQDVVDMMLGLQRMASASD